MSIKEIDYNGGKKLYAPEDRANFDVIEYLKSNGVEVDKKDNVVVKRDGEIKILRWVNNS